MALSALDRILIQRTDEAMKSFSFKQEDKRSKPLFWCPVEGCRTKTRGGPCQKHWRARNVK